MRKGCTACPVCTILIVALKKAALGRQLALSRGTPLPCMTCSEREKLLGMALISFITVFFLTE